MADSNTYICKHNPNKHHNWISRFTYFLFLRRDALNSFRCNTCGMPLRIPRMNALLKVAFFLSSILISFIILHLRYSGVIHSSPLIIVCFLYLLLFALYRVTSSIVLTFGNWFLSDYDANDRIQERALKHQGISFRSYALTGIIVCVTCMQETYITFFTLVASIVMIINCILHKRWRISTVGAISIIYLVLTILGRSENSVIERVILIVTISLSIAIT